MMFVFGDKNSDACFHIKKTVSVVMMKCGKYLNRKEMFLTWNFSYASLLLLSFEFSAQVP